MGLRYLWACVSGRGACRYDLEEGTIKEADCGVGFSTGFLIAGVFLHDITSIPFFKTDILEYAAAPRATTCCKFPGDHSRRFIRAPGLGFESARRQQIQSDRRCALFSKMIELGRNR